MTNQSLVLINCKPIFPTIKYIYVLKMYCDVTHFISLFMSIYPSSKARDHNQESATAFRVTACHRVFTNPSIFRLNFPRIQTPKVTFAQLITRLTWAYDTNLLRRRKNVSMTCYAKLRPGSLVITKVINVQTPCWQHPVLPSPEPPFRLNRIERGVAQNQCITGHRKS